MILAVKLLRDEIITMGGRRRTMALGVDNQAAIMATSASQSQPGHYLMDNFHDDLHDLLSYDNNDKLIIRWSAGHIGIPGNKQADELAKRAARGEMSETHLLPASLRSPNDTPITLCCEERDETVQHFLLGAQRNARHLAAMRAELGKRAQNLVSSLPSEMKAPHSRRNIPKDERSAQLFTKLNHFKTALIILTQA